LHGFPGGLVPFTAVKGKDDSMSSDSSVTPEQPPEPLEPSASVPETLPPPVTAVKYTRTASVWSSLIVGFLILIVLLIFITQNLTDAPVTFINFHWTLPLGVQLLLAAICGGLVTVFAGSARILQLRRAAKKNLLAATK
jgi:uncharacterized integral membrane protein